MRRNVVPWLKLAVCGVVLCGYLALLSTLMYPPVLLTPVVLAIAWMPLGERLHRDTRAYTHVTTALSIVTLSAIVAAGPQLGALNTVIGLMTLVQIHALVHVKRQRHYGYLMLMAFSQVMAASMMSPSPEIGLVYVLLVVFTIWTLVLLDIFRGTEEQGEIYVHGSLDYEARNGALREPGSRAFRRSMIGWVAGLTTAAVLLSAGLFLLIPRTEAGMFGRRDILPAQEEATTGLSNEINLSESGRITEDATAVMEARFPELPEGRFTGPMYWRVTTFDDYSGSGWTRRGLQSRGMILIRRAARFSAHPETTRGSEEGVYRADYAAKNTVEFEIFLTQLPEEGVPVLSLPLMVQPQNSDPGRWSWDAAGDFTVHVQSRGESGLTYRGVSVIQERSPEALRASRTDYRALMNQRDYALLTKQDLLPETLELVDRIVGRAETDYDKLAAIQRYLSSERYTYSLEVPDLPPDHPMDAFIMQVREGHCQFFASAMALMARSQGIPCRLVSGYRGGTYDPDNQAYTITANMAHIWVEVFIPDAGWTIFDPSPMLESPPVLSFRNIQSAYSTFVLRLKLLWLQNVVGYNAREERASLQPGSNEAGGAARTVSVRRERGFTAIADNMQSIIFGVAVAIGLMGAALILRSRRLARRATMGLDESQLRAIALYRLLQKRLARMGVACEGKTAEEIVDAAGREHPTLAGAVRATVSAYNRARFGAKGLAPDEFDALQRQVRQLQPQPAQR